MSATRPKPPPPRPPRPPPPPPPPKALILKRAPIGWNQNDVVEGGVIIGRIFFLDAVGPKERPWMWASGHNRQIHRAAHGYAATREEEMAAFAKSWRRS